MASEDNVPLTKEVPIPNESDTILTLPNGLTIRNYRQSDIPSVSHHANNKNVLKNLRNRVPYPYTEERAQQWFDIVSKPSNHIRTGAWTFSNGSQGPPIPTHYAIALHDHFIGSIGLEFGAPEEVYARTAELGYWLGEQHWGKGIMGVVAPAFVEWTWETFGVLVRLNAEVFERNLGSRRVLLKAGFEVEGRKRCAFMKEGFVGDVVVLGAVKPGF